MPLLWNGDLSTGNLSQYGQWEFGGTFDGTPPLSQRVQVAATIAGVTPCVGNRVMRIQCAPGDVYGAPPGSGWRTLSRVPPEQPNGSLTTRGSGYDSTYVMTVLVPNGFPGDRSLWTLPFEWHQTQGGTGQKPLHIIWQGSNVRVTLFGGNPNNPTSYLDTTVLNGYTQNAWYVIAFRFLHNSAPNGIFELWAGKVGTDTNMTRLLNVTNIATKMDGMNSYGLYGLYGPQSGQSTMTMFTSGNWEFSTVAEARTWGDGILQGGGGTPPPPANTEAHTGVWTSPSFVNSRSLILNPTVFGNWTTPSVVMSYGIAESDSHTGNWTTPSVVGPGVGARLGLTPEAPESLTLTPEPPDAI